MMASPISTLKNQRLPTHAPTRQSILPNFQKLGAPAEVSGVKITARPSE